MLIVGHGTRSKAGLSEFQQVTRTVDRMLPHVLVGFGYLELAEPDLVTAARLLVRQGATSIVLCPLLLMASGHARRDLPQLARQIGLEHPGVDVRIARHLGDHPCVLELSRRRLVACLDSQPSHPTVNVLVARGGLESDLPRQFQQFAARRPPLPGVSVRTAFLAMANPRWRDVLSDLVSSTEDRIVVQPHLLFQGDMRDRLISEVKQAQEKVGERQRWRVTDHLGAETEVCEALVQRFRAIWSNYSKMRAVNSVSGLADEEVGRTISPRR